jgi:hypothetical protein
MRTATATSSHDLHSLECAEKKIVQTKGLGPALLKAPRQHLAGVTSFAIQVHVPISKQCFSWTLTMQGISFIT